jgi:hypothetical protein
MFGIAHVIAGLGDHALLARTLGHRTESAEARHDESF